MTSVEDLRPRMREELEQFFLNAVVFEGKDLTILGWTDARTAESVFLSALR